MRTHSLTISSLVLLLAAPAFAQDRDPRGEAPRGSSSVNEVEQPGERATDDDTSLETATPDPTPRVPEVLQRDGGAELDVVEQGGVGGPVAYASAGVLEVGGSGSLFATDENVGLRFAPFVGWFVLDGLQLSYVHDVFGGKVGEDGTYFGTLALVELSGHFRINDRLLALVGAGPGYLFNGDDHGFAVKGRVGLDVLIGRSGIFRPDLYAVWGTAPMVPAVSTVPPSQWGYGLEISYGVMF